MREPWFLIVDADQRLPGDYLVRLTTAATLDRNLAYVQGAQVAGDSRAMNRFQRALSLDVSLFYFRDLVSRRRYGFIPLLGHGALVSRSAWEAAGGFPSVVSEDYAFAMTVVGRGYDSEYVRDVPSQEDFPVDFGGFIVRLRKYSSATADLLRGRVGNFLMSDASITERWDCLMLIAWYFTLPLMLVNTFASAYVVHRLRLDGQPYLAPVLPYLYSWMTFTVLGLLAAVAREFWNALRFYFWSIAVYASSIPVATVAFLQGLLGRARFERTPKNGDETSLALTHSLFTTAIGIVALVCSILWWSPFSPFLIAQGSAFTLFPLFGSLHRRNFRGAVARVLVYVPGAATLWALVAMWQATFF